MKRLTSEGRAAAKGRPAAEGRAAERRLVLLPEHRQAEGAKICKE